MPELPSITAPAIQDGRCDFLGRVAGELELTDDYMVQFFAPGNVSLMMA